jgi:hypothetical protein
MIRYIIIVFLLSFLAGGIDGIITINNKLDEAIAITIISNSKGIDEWEK